MVSVPCDGSGSGLVAGLAVYIESVCVSRLHEVSWTTSAQHLVFNCVYICHTETHWTPQVLVAFIT